MLVVAAAVAEPGGFTDEPLNLDQPRNQPGDGRQRIRNAVLASLEAAAALVLGCCSSGNRSLQPFGILANGNDDALPVVF